MKRASPASTKGPPPPQGGAGERPGCKATNGLEATIASRGTWRTAGAAALKGLTGLDGTGGGAAALRGLAGPDGPGRGAVALEGRLVPTEKEGAQGDDQEVVRPDWALSEQRCRKWEKRTHHTV